MREVGAVIDELRIGLLQSPATNDVVNVRDSSGFTTINAGNGNDVLRVTYDGTYDANGNLVGVQTGVNGVGKTATETFAVAAGASTRQFTLARTPTSAPFTRVLINGVPTTAFTVSGTTLTLAQPLAGPATVDVTYLTSVLNLIGNSGSYKYVIALGGNNPAGQGDALVNITNVPILTNGATLGINTLTIFGSDTSDTYLLRRNMVASLSHDASGPLTGDAQRINYDAFINGGLALNGGNDHFYLDDTTVPTTINGGTGNNAFQVGQVFQSPRLANANLPTADQFDTTLTSRGYLSNGISAPTTINGGTGTDSYIGYNNQASLSLNGGGGNNTFVIRSFVKLDPQKAKQRIVNVNGGLGSNVSSYEATAPVPIDGGTGSFNKLVIIGTEFGDQFVVTSNGRLEVLPAGGPG